MSSPQLLLDLVHKRLHTRKGKSQSSPIANPEVTKKEIAKLQIQEDRYNTAYAAELFSLEKLKEYTAPIQSRVAELKSQMRVTPQEESQTSAVAIPTENEIKAFAEKMSKNLTDLSFEQKRGIVRDTIEKIIGTQQQLQVIGAIPIPSNYVEYKTISRHRRPAKRWKINAF